MVWSQAREETEKIKAKLMIIPKVIFRVCQVMYSYNGLPRVDVPRKSHPLAPRKKIEFVRLDGSSSLFRFNPISLMSLQPTNHLFLRTSKATQVATKEKETNHVAMQRIAPSDA